MRGRWVWMIAAVVGVTAASAFGSNRPVIPHTPGNPPGGGVKVGRHPVLRVLRAPGLAGPLLRLRAGQRSHGFARIQPGNDLRQS